MESAHHPPVGRFAPSPSGPLHRGSLVAAIGSYLSARSRHGQWLLRMEDVDGGRVRPGAADAILRQLTDLALDWDGPVLVQSRRNDLYLAALGILQTSGYAYPCACTRAEIQAAGGVYPGTCRHGLPAGRSPRAWRLRLPEAPSSWQDRYLGWQRGRNGGDPVLLRADGYVAYLLACVVDDGAQGVSEIIRGADLLPFTPSQRTLQRALGFPSPAYGHLPVILGPDGRKLSKSSGAAPWQGNAGNAWQQALADLGWATPPAMRGASAQQWRDYALAELRQGKALWEGRHQ
ncbi:MAG: tRNA glutamyl-Q(34) synthetase GluQRS [Gammaproteobacteria bacterium]|nr:tRNA glutamyl-Q(34) synthetase GluQRS [Gammaproteobacteria bacterium]